MITPFNPNNKEQLTCEETLAPAMQITDKEDAAQYKAALIAYAQKFLDKQPRKDGRTAQSLVEENLGYYAAYYDHATQKRVQDLFMAIHPIFGSI